MFPTLASLVEERMRDDPELIHAVVHSLNQWLHETWSFNYQDRIFTVPVISLPIVEKAIEELEWCVERGAKAILIRPAPVPGYRGSRSFALPEFDPFWKRVVELDVLVTMHASDSGYSRYTADWEGSARPRNFRSRPTPFGWSRRWRDIQDSVAAWVCHGALFRFPDLKIAVIENGATWLRSAAGHPGRRLQEGARGFRRRPGGGDQAQHPRQPVLGGGPGSAVRPHRRRAGAVRLGLPPPRGTRRSRPDTSKRSRTCRSTSNE